MCRKRLTPAALAAATTLRVLWMLMRSNVALPFSTLMATRWMAASTPSMARSSEAGSVTSPRAGSILVARARCAVAALRTRGRTCSPRACSRSTRWRPTKPVAPVTRIICTSRQWPVVQDSVSGALRRKNAVHQAHGLGSAASLLAGWKRSKGCAEGCTRGWARLGAHAGQGEVGREVLALRDERASQQLILDVPLQGDQRRGPLAQSQPDDARTSRVGERSKAADDQREGADTFDSGGDGLHDVLLLRSGHSTQEAQREMQSLRPRRAQDGAVRVQQAYQSCQPLLHCAWQHDGDEEAPRGARCDRGHYCSFPRAAMGQIASTVPLRWAYASSKRLLTVHAWLAMMRTRSPRAGGHGQAEKSTG